KARHVISVVVPVKSRVLVDRPGEETAAQRAEGYETDSQLLEERQHFSFRPSPPQRVLALQGGHGLDCVGAPNGARAGFREAEVLDLARTYQVLHRTGNLFDRHRRIDAVL